MVTFDPALFRAQFPQFADDTIFPDALLIGQFELACDYVSPDEYGRMSAAARRQAVYLMTAHLLALGVIVASGGYTGQPGIVQSSSVGDVSVTLTPPPVKSQWRWWLNTTPYGSQLVALLEAQSAGGFYIGGLPERSAYRKVGGIF